MPTKQDSKSPLTLRGLLLGKPRITVLAGKNDPWFHFSITSEQTAEQIYYHAIAFVSRNKINLSDELRKTTLSLYSRHGNTVYIAMAECGDGYVAGLYLMQMENNVASTSDYYAEYNNEKGFVECKSIKGFLDIVFYNPEIFLVIYPHCTSIKRYIHKQIEKNKKPDAREIKKIILSAVDALIELNEKQNMICGGLSIDSIALHEDQWVVRDLSQAKKIGRKIFPQSYCLTEYTPPELYSAKKPPAASACIDVYALGVILEKLLLQDNSDEEDGIPGIIERNRRDYDRARNQIAENDFLSGNFSVEDFDSPESFMMCLAKWMRHPIPEKRPTLECIARNMQSLVVPEPAVRNPLLAPISYSSESSLESDVSDCESRSSENGAAFFSPSPRRKSLGGSSSSLGNGISSLEISGNSLSVK